MLREIQNIFPCFPIDFPIDFPIKISISKGSSRDLPFPPSAKPGHWVENARHAEAGQTDAGQFHTQHLASTRVAWCCMVLHKEMTIKNGDDPYISYIYGFIVYIYIIIYIYIWWWWWNYKSSTILLNHQLRKVAENCGNYSKLGGFGSTDSKCQPSSEPLTWLLSHRPWWNVIRPTQPAKAWSGMECPLTIPCLGDGETRIPRESCI